ncbi:MAG: glycosyltransferase family 4 protein [Maritimibacter sp.]|nr:glycosyltransferase family 4 protein [Maritimibacter sp.]
MAQRLAILLTGLGAGGAERVVALLVRHWVARGHEIHIISFDAPDAPVYFDVPPAVTLHRLDLSRPGRSAVGSIQRLVALRRRLAAIQPDTLISFLTKNNVLALLAAWRRPVRTVVCERNNPQRQQANRIWNRLMARLYPWADVIVMQTRASLACLPAGVENAVEVIPNPVEPPAARPAADGAARTLVAVGRLVPQKGFDMLIEAFSRIADDVPDWRLSIFGSGRMQTELTDQIDARGLGARIALAGQTDQPGAWVTGAGAFVLSSRYEGFPNVLAEAMSAGLPVVAFDCPFGPGEIVTDGVDGLLVPDGDVAALADALRRLLSDPALQARLGAAARETAETYAVPKVAARWDALLERQHDGRTGR